MSAYVLIDVSSKQAFIYKNNKLKKNLYNSFIIKMITEKLDDSERLDLPIYLSGYLKNCKGFIEDDGVVYSGGGNSIIEFNSGADAKEFIRGYSREVLKAYPDLELYISLVDEKEVNETDKGKKEKQIRNKLYKKIDEIKGQHRAQFRRVSYGVEAIDETGQPLFSSTKKLEQEDYSLSRKYLDDKLKVKLKKEVEDKSIILTYELQDYKKDEGKSYIGVVAIDGNKMGEMVQRIDEFEELRKFSEKIDSLYTEAVAEAMREYSKSVQKSDTDQKVSIYVTPVVLAGDDICLILEAEHALQIAAKIVRNIEELSSNEDYKDLHKYKPLKACAGVAIARYNYPFFEAVTTAENLCHSAKEAIYKISPDKDANGAFINWDVVQKQVESTHEYEDYVRHGEYKEKFHIKPLRIDQKEAVNRLKKVIYNYAAFWQLTEQINKGIPKEISSGTLEAIKALIYSGKEEYDLFFKMKQTDDIEKLDEIVKENYPDSNNAVIGKKDSDCSEYTYVLNDVLDVLPFMNRVEEGKNR